MSRSTLDRYGSKGTAIGQVRGLGSAHGGAHHWLQQRFTAIGNLVTVLFLAISLALLPGYDYATMREWASGVIPATALALMIHETPSCFIAQMLARWLSSLGMMRCPRPCLGRKTTSLSFNWPVKNSSEGLPNGVSTGTHSWASKPSISYNPLPPMIPILFMPQPHYPTELGKQNNINKKYKTINCIHSR